MRIIMPPKTAHFKSGILFFNITQKRYTIVDEDIISGTDMCFIFSEHSIYASLGISAEFYVRVHETGDVYGPYPDPTSIVTLHLFGRYDNLVGFLRKSFVQNSETNSIEFSFNGFRYGKFTYDFDGNLSQVARDIYLQIPPIEDPFEYEFGATTFFADGAIELFVNKLNVLFNASNFNEEFDDTGKYMLASVDRASGLGARMDSGRSIIFMNASELPLSMLRCAPVMITGLWQFSIRNDNAADAKCRVSVPIVKTIPCTSSLFISVTMDFATSWYSVSPISSLIMFMIFFEPILAILVSSGSMEMKSSAV